MAVGYRKMCIRDSGELSWNDKKLVINEGKIGELSLKLYETITGIQCGELEDKFGWTLEVK